MFLFLLLHFCEWNAEQVAYNGNIRGVDYANVVNVNLVINRWFLLG